MVKSKDKRKTTIHDLFRQVHMDSKTDFVNSADNTFLIKVLQIDKIYTEFSPQ